MAFYYGTDEDRRRNYVTNTSKHFVSTTRLTQRGFTQNIHNNFMDIFDFNRPSERSDQVIRPVYIKIP